MEFRSAVTWPRNIRQLVHDRSGSILRDRQLLGAPRIVDTFTGRIGNVAASSCPDLEQTKAQSRRRCHRRSAGRLTG